MVWGGGVVIFHFDPFQSLSVIFMGDGTDFVATMFLHIFRVNEGL